MARQALKDDSASIPVLGKLSKPFSPARGGVLADEALQDFSSARWREEAIDDHAELLAAIEAQDTERSGNAMRARLEHQLTAAISHTPS